MARTTTTSPVLSLLERYMHLGAIGALVGASGNVLPAEQERLVQIGAGPALGPDDVHAVLALALGDNPDMLDEIRDQCDSLSGCAEWLPAALAIRPALAQAGSVVTLARVLERLGLAAALAMVIVRLCACRSSDVAYGVLAGLRSRRRIGTAIRTSLLASDRERLENRFTLDGAVYADWVLPTIEQVALILAASCPAQPDGPDWLRVAGEMTFGMRASDGIDSRTLATIAVESSGWRVFGLSCQLDVVVLPCRLGFRSESQ